jgi:DNA-binding NarL/FixJ family response regulator
MNKFKRRVIIVEHNTKFRELTCSLIEAMDSYVVVNAYPECEDALYSMKGDYPDIILMNIDFPRMKGPDAISEFKKIFPQTNILVITDYQDDDTIFNTLGAGANGYVLKNNWLNNFSNHLSELSQGGSPLSPIVARVIVNSLHVSRISPLTHREGEVLKLITQGNSYSRIASELNISKETSKTHIRNIYRKLNVKTKSDVVRKAFEERIVPVAWSQPHEN